jgi:limonene-1,2-epoxide hydrolase
MRVLAIVLAVLALTACGATKTASPPDVVRAWSAALDRNDNEQAARLFADGARVIQNGETILATHADAVQWNAALPCGGRISHLEVESKSQVLAVFDLQERPQHRCDGTGGQAAAIFQVEHGRIVLWHQTAVPAPSAPGGGQVI